MKSVCWLRSSQHEQQQTWPGSIMELGCMDPWVGGSPGSSLRESPHISISLRGTQKVAFPLRGSLLMEGFQSGSREGLDWRPVPGVFLLCYSGTCACVCVSKRKKARALKQLLWLLNACCSDMCAKHLPHTNQYCPTTSHGPTCAACWSSQQLGRMGVTL